MAALTAVAVADPAISPLFAPCLWRAATGWLCPGCGSARAMHALMHGHIGLALRHNPLAVAALPMGAIDIARRFLWNDGSLTSGARPVFLYGLTAAIVLFGIVRNLLS